MTKKLWNRRWAGSATALAVVATLAACGVTNPNEETSDGATCERSDEKVIGFDFPLSTLAIYEPLTQGFKDYAEDKGYKAVITTNNANLQQQTDDLNTWVTQRVQAFTTYALEPASLAPVASAADKACVGFISYGAPIEGEDGAVVFPWEQNGEIQGEAATAWAKENGKPIKALVLNATDISAGKARYEGTMSKFPGDADNVEIVSDQRATDQESGERVTATVLQANPDLNMVIAYNDDVAIGARQAFLNAGASDNDPDIYISGSDGGVPALELVKKGGIFRATVGFDPEEVISTITQLTIDVAEQKEVESKPLTPYLLTADDSARIDSFISYFDK